MTAAVLPLVCPVRRCAAALTAVEGGVACGVGHRFDRARSGYINLLTPQDRRSPVAGDAKASVLARARSHERGLGAAVVAALRTALTARALGAGARVLDVGAGDGWVLASVLGETALEGWGVDLSTAAAEHAARRYPAHSWVVANGDRVLPFAAGSFEAVISVDACKNPAEFLRLLAPAGQLLLAVPGADDFFELRQVLFGRATEKPRAERALERFAPFFTLAARTEVRERLRLDRDALTDLFASAYRGVRHRERERLATLEALDVTSSHTLLTLTAREGATSPRG